MRFSFTGCAAEDWGWRGYWTSTGIKKGVASGGESGFQSNRRRGGGGGRSQPMAVMGSLKRVRGGIN